jgi:septal ring factor EnvC (AmiA/AmiB activator)
LSGFRASFITPAVLVCFWALGPDQAIQAQAPQEEVNQASEQLERLREEIKRFELRLSESRHQEQDLLNELEDFDREISLRFELIGTLETERNRAQKSLERTQGELNALQTDIDRTTGDSLKTAQERDSLAALVSRRAVYTYKYLHRDVLTAVLTSQSLVEMMRRQEFLKRIAEADRTNLMRLDRKNRELADIARRLAKRKSAKQTRLEEHRRTTQYKDKLIREEASAADLLKKRRGERESLLDKIRKDQGLLHKQLAEKKLAAQRVENLIKTLESRRESLPIRAEMAWAPETPFDQLKGKLNWPTLGRVVTWFGLQRHQTLATVTENPGIEIEAEEGTPVYSVSTGQVTRITWLRGYGNTVIVDHRDGYYTVYAHLGQILVREGQVVNSGETIGRVGQTGTLSGPRLHFEIWAQREKQDPLGWLLEK